MVRKTLLERKKGKYYSKSIEILENPKNIFPALNPIGWKILNLLNKYPSYPSELAKNLKMDEQKIYYHINKLKSAGLVEVVKEEMRKGAICRYFAPVSSAFGIEIEEIGEETKIENEKASQKIKDFFYEFIKDGIFDGSIVVGSPLQHGPFLTAARDGHYAVQLAMFLGNFCELTNRFVVKLDTEVKAEKAEKRNMILVGGPVTNMVSSDINEKLKIRFKWQNGWRIFSETTKQEYADEDIGLIAKIKNPWDETKSIILLAGLKFEGTKSCIIAVTNYFDKILKNYEKNKDFFSLIRGLDKDGDGKVDDIDVLE